MYLITIACFLGISHILCGLELSGDAVDRNYGIPRKIWQTYKDRQLPRPAAEARKSWLELNPNYDYIFMDDAEVEDYISTRCNSDTYAFFKALPIGVMKADLWRYLIIADQGGIYTDIDTKCCLPIDYWLKHLGSLYKLEEGMPLLFLGIENDDGTLVIDFCQWTFLATPKHPAMEFACKYIVDHWLKNGIDITRENFVHLTTGPTILKYALMTYIDEHLSMRANDLYKKYKADKTCRKKINDLGIYLLPKMFFDGFASIHLVGSMNFGEDYIRWSDEARSYRARIRNCHATPL